jgi:ribosome-associated protein
VADRAGVPAAADDGVDEEVEVEVVGQPDGGSEPVRWVRTAARAAAGKTDEEVVVLEVGRILAIVGWFVVAAGRNPRQVRAIAEEIEDQVARAGGPRPQRVEGLNTLEWVLLDYGDFVVHVFHVETRKFYELERLWRDVPRLQWREPAPDAAPA